VHKVVLPSEARTAATYTSPAIASEGRLGGKFYLNITNLTGTLDVKIQNLDEISGNWVDMPGCAFAQKNGTGTSELVIYPGVAETASVSQSDVLGGAFRANCVVATGPITFSIGVDLKGQ